MTSRDLRDLRDLLPPSHPAPSLPSTFPRLASRQDLDEDEALAARDLYEKHRADGTLPTVDSRANDKDQYSNKWERRVAARLTPTDLGIVRLREDIISLEEAVLDGLNRYYSPWSTTAGGRAAWLLSARSSTSVVELAQLLTSLEAAARDLQGVPDVNERKPWHTDGHPFVGRMARRFFPVHGASDGRIVGWLPPEGEDAALWHMVHGDDADEEDLDETEAMYAIANFAENRIEPTAEEAAYLKQFEEGAGAAAAEEEEEEEEEEDEDDAAADADWGGLGAELSGSSRMRETRGGERERSRLPRVLPGQKVKKALWISAEARERWAAALSGTPTVGAVALAAVAFRQHARAFGLISQMNEPKAQRLTPEDIEQQLRSWCHPTALGVESKKAGKKGKKPFAKGRR